MKKGYLHIYMGEGKGKTSILNGMVLRAVGANMNVKYIRFLKNRATNENSVLEKIGVIVETYYISSTKFFWEMNDLEKEIFKKETLIGFEKFKYYLKSDVIDIIFVDEILGALENGFIKEDELIDVLLSRNPKIEVCMSGRYCSDRLIDNVDLVSILEPKKHYFTKGVKLRKGIEF